MKVYVLGLQNGVSLLFPADESFSLLDLGRKGGRMSEKWPVPELVTLRESIPPFTDITSIRANEGYPLLSNRVRSALRSELEIAGEWLEVNFDLYSYSLLNLLNVIEAIEVEKSSILYYSGKRSKIMDIRQYAFFEEAVEPEWLFRAALYPYRIYCTDRFVDYVKDKGWTGFGFTPVWDSDHAPFPRLPTADDIAARPEIYGPEGFVKGHEHRWPAHWKSR